MCVVRGLGCSVTCIPTFAMIPERASSIAWRCAACSATSADTALPRDCRERRDCEDAAVPRDCRERRDFGEWRELCAEPTLRGALATLERQERSYVLLLQWTVLAATGVTGDRGAWSSYEPAVIIEITVPSSSPPPSSWSRLTPPSRVDARDKLHAAGDGGGLDAKRCFASPGRPHPD